MNGLRRLGTGSGPGLGVRVLQTTLELLTQETGPFAVKIVTRHEKIKVINVSVKFWFEVPWC